MLANDAVLAAKGIGLRYPGQSANLLSDFDLLLRRGEIVSLLGPSGVGKSSLLRVLAGLQQSIDGVVTINQNPVQGVHPRVAIAFQDPSLLPWLTLEKNVAFGLDFKHQPKLSAAERRARVDVAINEVGLSHARSLYPSALSGGMAQRTALARCLARKPEILLLDEPFGALDEVTRSEMQQLLLKIVRDFDTAALLITHDIDEALLVSDRIVLLGGGPAREVGHWTIELPKPREDYVAELGALRVEVLTTLRRAMARRH
ncbi:ABC transporter ATP-binding protein [Bradyrhizobium sp. LHD-71]|uniref:ABC transporter ATP-binding protein n=1 Tax=Bradyrhizobium sp. LHD-71 TaxID=3072141 RepID=UPI00280D9597|nr:ABC transporter ATP-binding protein [Bradyrhizobium sp. LHD-71]MDQ8731022.1 ABC transporter ATP-binding protein [Bradyrhizobium sp. LHD-71]